MPLLFFGSSEQTIKQPQATAEVLDKLAELSTDDPLPELAPADRIRLLAQSPRRLYLYWDFATDPFEALRRAFGSQAERYSLVVRLVSPDEGTQTLHLASKSNSQWFDIQPGGSYKAEVGLYAPGRAFIRLLSSNIIGAPRAGVARAADPTPQWHVSAAKFARVLDEAGYVSDALEVSLEAADEASKDVATRTIARAFGDVDIPPMTEETLAEMRSLLAALAFGAHYDSLERVLSPTLAAWLFEVNQHRGRLDALRLQEVLRALIGLELTPLPEDAAGEELLRRAARVIVGASEINLPARPFHLWMPSMNLGRLQKIDVQTH